MKVFNWDPYSDQYEPIVDKTFKKEQRKKAFGSFLYTVFISLIVFPFTLLFLSLIKKRDINTSDFFGMSVNLDKEPELTSELINELGVKNLLVRFDMADFKNIDKYVDFVKTLQCDSILINIMQDPYMIKDYAVLEKQFKIIFEKFSPHAQIFQVGTTINRVKWGFFSVNDYLKFYKIAYKIKKRDFKELKLLGPSVIDFEYHFLAHSLFNFYNLRFDGISALLYVDRRGAPENTQAGFNLISKINLLYALATFSPKSTNEVYITEVNWPIKNTAPYAPTSEARCFSLDKYTNYMVRYYLQSLCSNMVKAVYWHQLIAPGLGLIDNREGKIVKYPAFNAFKVMLEQVQGAKIINYIEHKDFYEVVMEKDEIKKQVFWTNDKKHILNFNKMMKITYQNGEIKERKEIKLFNEVVYIQEIS